MALKHPEFNQPEFNRLEFDPFSCPKPVYELLPAQEKFIYIPDDSVHIDVCVYQGGFGSGKTFIGSLLGHYLSVTTPKNRGIVVAQTYPLVRDTTLQSYFEHFDKLGMRANKDYWWKATEQKIRYRNGSEILFRHLDDPTRIKSLNLGWAHMEEMGDMDESGFLMLLSRLRLQGIKRYRLFGTTNPQGSAPQGGAGWLRRYFEKDKIYLIDDRKIQSGAEAEVFESNELQMRKIQYRRIIAPSTENHHLSAGYLENMRQQYSAEYYRMNVLGQDTELKKGLVCPQFSDANLDGSISYQSNLRLYLSCDFNVDPMCWVVAHRVQIPGELTQYEFIDELCIENTNIVQTAEEFARRYGLHEAGLVITGDASGRTRSDSSANPNDSKYRILMNTLSNLGMKNITLDVTAANPHQDVRVETWNGLLCNHEFVRRIKINPERCPWLVWNLNNLRYLPGSSVISEPSPRRIEHDSSHMLKFTKHPFDAASYLTCRYDSIRRDAMPKTTATVRWHPFTPRG